MENDLLKLNILTIAASGFIMLFIGLLLYFFRDSIGGNLRFFLPIPPIGVGAYIYVFNMFGHYQGGLPEGASAIAKEILMSGVIMAIVFLLMVIANISITYLLKTFF